MKKKILTGLLLSMALMVNVGQVSAASPLIEFDGDSENYFQFSTSQDELTDKFIGMMPGESRSETFTLINHDKREMKYYLNTQVLKDLGEDNKTSGAVYEISFERDGEEFYRGTVGGENGSLVDLSGESMGENMLMATLAENEQTEIKMSIGIDGDSMDNTYQNAVGELQFVFSVQYDDPVITPPTIVEKVVVKPGKEIIRYVGAVITGDETNILPLLCGVGISGLLIGFLVVTKKKKNEKGE